MLFKGPQLVIYMIFIRFCEFFALHERKLQSVLKEGALSVALASRHVCVSTDRRHKHHCRHIYV